MAQEELINAVKAISSNVKNNIISIDSIDESIINNHLYTQNLPDVDLLIRTSGEQRISNFYFGKLPMPNYTLLIFFGQTFKRKIYIKPLSAMNNVKEDLVKQVNNLANNQKI